MRTRNPRNQFGVGAAHAKRAAGPRPCAPGLRSSLLAMLVAGMLAGLQMCAAQVVTPPAPQAAADQKPAPKKAHSRKHAKAEKTEVAAPTVAPEPVKPPEPEAPKWPVNEKPEDAKVTWDSQGLSISAANSSLTQILNEVAAETGAKVEGIGRDLRIFGTYGPGTPRDVLSQLLEGSGYNVLMIGDQGQGAPRQILLSERHNGDATGNGPHQASAPAADEDVEQPAVEDQNQQQNPPFRPAFQPPNQRPPTPGQTQPPTPQPGSPQE
jgi:outer membrane biosynthesis protein TonB